MAAHDPAPGAAARRIYPLFTDGRPVGTLEWRQSERRGTGWYLLREGRQDERLDVDRTIDELAADERSSDHAWELNAELAAILSTALALDAAGRALRGPEPPRSRRFRRPGSSRRYGIYVAGLDPTLLAHAVPELGLSSVADVALVEGELLVDALQPVLRRIRLLGGRVVAVVADDETGG